METLILKNSTKKDLSLLLTIAKKMGLDLALSETIKPKNIRSERLLQLRSLALKADAGVIPNNISMTEIVIENNLVRKQMYDAGKHNN